MNHTLPSGPGVMPLAAEVAVANSVTLPPGVIRPILVTPGSVNHRLPSGPVVIRAGAAEGVSPPSSTKLADPALAGDGSATSRAAPTTTAAASARPARRRDGSAECIEVVIDAPAPKLSRGPQSSVRLRGRRSGSRPGRPRPRTTPHRGPRTPRSPRGGPPSGPWRTHPPPRAGRETIPPPPRPRRPCPAG